MSFPDDIMRYESVDGTNLFSVDNSGNVTAAGTISAAAPTFSGAITDSDGGTVEGVQNASIDDGDSPYTVGAYSMYISADPTNGAISVNLPALAGVTNGARVLVSDSGGAAGSNNITVNANGSETFVGLSGSAVTDPAVIAVNSGWIFFEKHPAHWLVIGSKLS